MRTLTVSAALFASGCFVYGSGPDHRSKAPKNYAPVIDVADASCYWDDYYADDVWWFQADVTDPNGLDDITGVYADVYDGQTGEWVDAFELYYDQGDTFYSAWQGRSTYLDCGYYDYLVDFTPEDTAGPGEVYTIDLY